MILRTDSRNSTGWSPCLARLARRLITWLAHEFILPAILEAPRGSYGLPRGRCL